ncbi:MAG: glycosyltransferase [Marinibacterium sp.]
MLDLTRTLRRAGRRATGIDRVELAYLDAVLADPVPAFGLVRTGAGYLVLDQDGLRAARNRLWGLTPWGPVDALSALYRRRPPVIRQAESDLRRLAVARGRPGRLSAILADHLPTGTAYFNVGHAQLDPAPLAAIRAASGGPVVVFVHDTIPLDFPAYQRPETQAAFSARLRAVGDCADLILCASGYVRSCLGAHLPGSEPRILVAPLGVSVADPDPTLLPGGLPKDPYFVTVGTIEPRKRHDLLLDVWESLARDLPPEKRPQLVVCGARGWADASLFSRLDALSKTGSIRVMSDLPDAAVAALIAGARALLFPSEAEGYGLPPLEALALGTVPVLANLPVYRETLGNKAVYLMETDCYLWRDIVGRLMVTSGRGHGDDATCGFVPPSWTNHFGVVFDVV